MFFTILDVIIGLSFSYCLVALAVIPHQRRVGEFQEREGI